MKGPGPYVAPWREMSVSTAWKVPGQPLWRAPHPSVIRTHPGGPRMWGYSPPEGALATPSPSEVRPGSLPGGLTRKAASQLLDAMDSSPMDSFSTASSGLGTGALQDTENSCSLGQSSGV